MNRKPRVLFAGGGTGGHLYPALALARAFEARPGGADVFFLGALRGVEAQVLPRRNVRHQLLPFEPIRRTRVWENWKLVPALAKVAAGVSRVFIEFQPDLVVGTGGYASGPVVAWGTLKRVPTAIQEQNSFPGITTRWLASRVRQIHIAFPEALRYLKPGRTTEVFELGNPILPPDRSIDPLAARERFGLRDGPVVLVVGGSQGARPVNDALLRDLSELGAGTGGVPPKPSGLQLLWATGPKNYDPVRAGVERLNLGDWVKVLPYIDDMPSALAVADVALSRAGAMALAELCAWGIPSILVPFPHAAANHQYHNAKALADAGAAVMVTESDLAPGRLWAEVAALVGNVGRRSELAARASARGHPNAAAEIVEKLAGLIPG